MPLMSVSGPAMQRMASAPWACKAATCSEAASARSAAVSSFVWAELPIEASEKKPIFLPASSTMVFMPLEMRLRLQLVERASNASFSVVYRLEAIEGPVAVITSLRRRSVPYAISEASKACKSYPDAAKALVISMPPVRLARAVPCKLPPASTRMESSLPAFRAAMSARPTSSPSVKPCRLPVT